MQRTPVLAAIEAGDVEGLARVLDDGRDVNAPVNLLPERTALELAVHCGHLPLVTFLLKRGASPSHRTTEDSDALSLAVQEGHAAMLEPLLTAGAAGVNELRGRMSAGNQQTLERAGMFGTSSTLAVGGITPLALAAMANSAACVKELVRLGAEVNRVSPALGFTPVQHAVHSGSPQALAALLDAGANLAARDSKKRTLLHLAASGPSDGGYARPEGEQAPGSCGADNCRHARCLRELFSRGCCLGLVEDQEAERGHTAVQEACRAGHSAMLQVLLGNGGQPAQRPGQHSSAEPLTLACRAGSPRCVEVLMSQGAAYVGSSLPDCNLDGVTPLVLALLPDDDEGREELTPGHLACARLLLDRGVATPNEVAGFMLDPRIPLTPLHALLCGAVEVSPEAVQLLLDAGAAVEGTAASATLGSPLLIAIGTGRLEVAQLLLDRGASLASRNAAGFTALCFGMFSADRLRLVLAAMQRQLSRSQRAQLYQARTVQGEAPWEVSVPEGDRPSPECRQLLQQAIRQDGIDLQVPGAQPSPAAAGTSSGSSGTHSAGSSGGGSGGSEQQQQQQQQQQQNNKKKGKKPKSRLGPALSQSELRADTTLEEMERAGAGLTWINATDSKQAAASLAAVFDAKERIAPHEIYMDVFDSAWRTLGPAAQQAEACRVLGLLQPGVDLEAQTDALAFLAWAVQNSTLRALLLKSGLVRRLCQLATPEAVHRELRWHCVLLFTMLHMTVAQPELSQQLWCAPQLGGYLLSYLEHALPPTRGGGGTSNAELATSLADVAASMDPVGLVQLERCVGMLGKAEEIETAVRGWHGSHDAARLLIVRSCALVMSGPQDAARVTATAIVHALELLGAAGMSATLEDPQQDFLNRSPEARRLFLACGILPKLVDLLKSCDKDEHRHLLTQHLGLLGSSCSSQMVQHGVIRAFLGLAAGQEYGWDVRTSAASSLSLLTCYGSELTCKRIWKAGMLSVHNTQLDLLLAAADQGPQMLATQLPLALAFNEMCKALLHVLHKADADCWMGEAGKLGLPSKALRLLVAAADVPGTRQGRGHEEEWASVQRQLGVLTLTMAVHPRWRLIHRRGGADHHCHGVPQGSHVGQGKPVGAMDDDHAVWRDASCCRASPARRAPSAGHAGAARPSLAGGAAPHTSAAAGPGSHERSEQPARGPVFYGAAQHAGRGRAGPGWQAAEGGPLCLLCTLLHPGALL